MNSAESKPPGKPGDIMVFMVRRETKCAECGCELFDGNLLRMEDNRPLCLDCAELLMKLGDRQLARTKVRKNIEDVLSRWELPAAPD